VDVRLTEEQHALQQAARGWLAQRFSPERIAAVADAPPAADPALWREIAAMGWVGLAVPEERGGGGASLVEEALLAEECGRGLLPAPWLASVLAIPALAAADDSALLEAVLSGARSATVAHAEPGGAVCLSDPARAVTADAEGRLTGRKSHVFDLPVVTDVVVTVAGAAGSELWTVDVHDRPEVVEPIATADGTRPLGTLVLDGTPGRLLVRGQSAAAALAQTRARGLVLVAAETVGVGQRCLEMAVDYAKQREQFGRPIATYQAVAFALADSYAGIERARSLAYWAAWASAYGDPQAEMAASAARVAAADAAVFAAERAIQTFGGIGMTWDAPVHRWYKRALAATVFEGTSTAHRDQVAAALLDTAV
jgi:alkylation response protein AidB-like acyl-CoA dehydrogenase